jgi:hypothetical protein
VEWGEEEEATQGTTGYDGAPPGQPQCTTAANQSIAGTIDPTN